jgi:tRNA A-37 threonylcarbamoyl transferase component Bud32
MVGKPTRVAGWKLHVSASIACIDSLFERVLPFLVRRHAQFKMAADRDVMVQLSAGDLGEEQIGKVITVYPRNDTEAAALARELIESTHGVVGPSIATDLHLGNAVYARYGAVRPRIVHDRFGEPTELILDGFGNWLPDMRGVPFNYPQGITVPFVAAASVPPVAGPEARKLLAGRYFVTDVLRPGLAGSVLRAIDIRDVKRVSACVLKQARPYCSEDALGRDRRFRLRHEAAVLRRLRGLRGIASCNDYFEDEDIGYLPIAYVPGRTLAELVYQHVTGRPWRRLESQHRHRLLRYAAQLVGRLRAAHDRGVIHRDLSPGNVWIGEDGHVYLLDWECAHVLGSRTPAFRLGTPGFSDLGYKRRTPSPRDDWQACGRVLAFMLTGLDPSAFMHGRQRELAARLAEITELHGASLIELLGRTLAKQPSEELDAAKLRAAIASMARARRSRRFQPVAPLFTTANHESVLADGLETMTAALRAKLDRIHNRRATQEAAAIDVQSGIPGMLYVLAAGHRAQVAHLAPTLGNRAERVLLSPATVTPDLPGLVHGRAGRAVAVAAAVQARCIPPTAELCANLVSALDGRLDWPDFTHGAAGQGFAALDCARRLGVPHLAAGAAACAAYLVRTQNSQGAWTLPEGAPGASGERYTGFAHGAAGMMGFLGTYAAFARDAAADAAWRRAECWLIKRARRGRGAKWYWPQSDSLAAPAPWWCHGAPGIALGWLCVAQAQGITAIAEEHLRRALDASPQKPRSDSLGQCHGLAGIGEVYLDAHRVLKEECWRERAADIANVLVALFLRGSREPWHYSSDEPSGDAEGLMLGSAGILHFLLRYHHPAVVTTAPLLV